ncbi:hypothetical protein N8835_06060 [Alphaproteobacteria bacterium]|nr:hypothetical protein [Alphaproteobacteria bacterium]
MKQAVTTILGLGLSVMLLSSCDEMTRFQQESYACGYNPTGIYEIVLRSTKVGDDAVVTTNKGEEAMEIIFADDSSFILEIDGTILRINRDTGGIKVTRGTRYRNLTCEKAVFKM